MPSSRSLCSTLARLLPNLPNLLLSSSASSLPNPSRKSHLLLPAQLLATQTLLQPISSETSYWPSKLYYNQSATRQALKQFLIASRRREMLTFWADGEGQVFTNIIRPVMGHRNDNTNILPAWAGTERTTENTETHLHTMWKKKVIPTISPRSRAWFPWTAVISTLASPCWRDYTAWTATGRDSRE